MFLYTLTSAAFLQAIIKEHTKSAPDQSKPTHQTWAARWERCDGRQHDGWINMSFWFWWVQLTIGGQQNLVNYGNVLSFVSIANWWVHSDSINPVSPKAIAGKYLEKHKAKQGVYVERMLTHHFAAVWIIKNNHQFKCSLPPKICEVGWGRYSLLCLLKHLPTGLMAVPRLQVWALPNRLRACRGPIKNKRKNWESTQLNISEIQIGFCGATILLPIFVYLLKSSHLPIPVSASDQLEHTHTHAIPWASPALLAHHGCSSYNGHATASKSKQFCIQRLMESYLL